jgi:enoyl-CoA hydratase/carnithine racemase
MSQLAAETVLNTITWEADGPVGFIHLNRPDKHNAISIEMMRELRRAVEQAALDTDIHVIVLAANGGKSFSAGIDLSAGILEPAADLKQCMIDDYLPLAESLQNCNKLIIASVEGAAIGLACSLVLLCDQVYLSEQASLNLVFTDLGLVADGGANWLLARKVGYNLGLQLLLEAEKLTPERCLALGLASRVFPSERMAESVRELARKLASRSVMPQAYSKQLLRAAMDGASLSEIIHQEADAQSACVGSPYFQRAYTRLRSPDPSSKGTS